MALSPVVDSLLSEIEADSHTATRSTHADVSRAVSAFAVLYEKARNAVEFRADHLVRRAAIERILKRRFLINGGPTAIAESLITELLWARYIDSALITDAKTSTIQTIINRYGQVKHVMDASSHGRFISWDFLTGLASSEIEETLISGRKRSAITNFFYQAIRPDITLPGMDEQYVNLLSFIAVERAYSQSDDAILSYHVLRIMLPEWFTNEEQSVEKNWKNFLQVSEMMHKAMRDTNSDALFRYVRKHAPPFLLLQDFLFETGDKARGMIEDKAVFEQKLAEIAGSRYHAIGNKVKRAIVRSFIYIFFTKMIFAFALEAPYDLLILKKIAYLPLAVNTLFPPILLILVAGLFTVPGSDNTRRLIDRLFTIIYRFDSLKSDTDSFVAVPHVRRPLLGTVFSLFYLATYGITFGLIHYALTALHFSIASQIIFIFFVALISFFAYRIRLSAKEYEMVEHQGILEPLFDFFFLPILRAGHILSQGIAKINIFIFLFDFILEAPLKVIFDVVEEWIRFIRIKKDEII
ncbi:MAG: hypothetical protein AAB800_03990 [Patescibacteria group bacterium]